MNNFLRISMVFVSFFVLSSMNAQSYIVEFHSQKLANEFFSESRNAILDIDKISQLSPLYNIYTNALEDDQIETLLNDPKVSRFLKDEKVKNRECCS